MDRENDLFEDIANKRIDRGMLLEMVLKDPGLVPKLIEGTTSSKALVRYGCANVLTDLSKERPEDLYPHFDDIAGLLDSGYRILVWNGLAMLSNLAKIDRHDRFDKIKDRYYAFLKDDYMVTVANTVDNSTAIAKAKPHLIPYITERILDVENIELTEHLTEECKNIIIQKSVAYLDSVYDEIEDRERVLSFVEKQVGSGRKTLADAAKGFLKKHS